VVTVGNVPPVAAFTYDPLSPTTADTVTFTDASTDSDGTIASWAWTFGDTGTSTDQNPTHQYSVNGVYTVRLTVTDDDGATNYVEHEVTVLKLHQISVKTGWNLISLPVYDTISKTNIIVRYSGTDYSWDDAKGSIVLDTLYNWQRGTTQAYDPTNTLVPGNGYWMWAYHDCEILIASNVVGTGHITDLQTKWNIMGLPYETPLTATNLKIVNNSIELTWDQALSQHVILGFIYRWDGSTQMYTLQTTFEPGQGYWMYAYYDCTLKS
jgi:uncharacterized membrane protein